MTNLELIKACRERRRGSIGPSIRSSGGLHSLEALRPLGLLCAGSLALLLSMTSFVAVAQEGEAIAEIAGPPTSAEVLPVVVAQFTTAIEDREPIDQVTFVQTDIKKIYFFTDLRGLEGQTVLHRWIFADKAVAEVPFEVRGPRWRVWSSKELLPEWLGDWTVEIVNGDGEVMAAETFSYSAPDA